MQENDVKEKELEKEEEKELEEEVKETVENQEEKKEDDKDSLKKKAEEATEKFVRLQAEFQNYKKRTEKEKANLYKFANEKLILDLLPLMDNMERAIENSKDSSEKVVDGIKMIKKSLDEFFEKNGVKYIDAVGKPFDPEYHHAVMTEENDDIESEHIIEEFQKGYMLNEKVIRHSMVKVSK